MPVWKKNLTVRQALASWYMLFFQIPALPEWLLSRNNFALLERGLQAASIENHEIFTVHDVAEYKASWNRPGALTGGVNYYRANFPRTFFSNTKSSASSTQPEKIRVPALFIYGEKDRFIMPETVKNVGEFIDAPFEEFHIPDAGHWVQQEAAETVTQILREFLADKQTE
jgi:pimeloyl-ACP methyl ester carboxylesterase